MSIPYNLLRLRIAPAAVCNNYRRLKSTGGNAIAVVKADAYGHGLKPVAAALASAGCTRMAVGTVEEAVYLRQTGFAGQVIALLGTQDGHEVRACVEHDIMPFVARMDQLERQAEAAVDLPRPFPICLKFDSGMRRLGFEPSRARARELARMLARTPSLRLAMAASHLATADMPEEESFTLQQGHVFQDICDALARELPPFERCLANSAAILAFGELRLEVQRPGIAMYGANPFYGTSWQHLGEGLEPAMSATAPVLQVRELAPGDTVSYGRTFTAERTMRIAIVAAGYADCFSRGLSSADGQGPAMLLHGQRAPIVGRVCMQMTAVEVTHIPQTREGERAHLLGGPGGNAIRAEELAQWWGTIPYEVFCVLGLNRKEYV